MQGLLSEAVHRLSTEMSHTALYKAEIEHSRQLTSRKALKHLLTVCDVELSKETKDAVEGFLKEEATCRGIIASSSLPTRKTIGRKEETHVKLWRGDITVLQIEAIVNAANSMLGGCYVINHPCIDNAIYNAAGPRIREASKNIIKEQGKPEKEGLAKLTGAFALPCKYVIHTVAPQTHGRITERNSRKLKECYTSTLDLCKKRGIREVAFNCLGTGMFGFPAGPAAKLAWSAVADWVDQNDGAMDMIVFDVFTEQDEEIYNDVLGFGDFQDDMNGIAGESLYTSGADGQVSGSECSCSPTEKQSENLECRLRKHTRDIQQSAKWLRDADAILIVAGAGMSANDGYNVYVNEDDFEKHYPGLRSNFGYRTAYESMGLFSDQRVPDVVKWGFQAKHMRNMRWDFPTNSGYDALRELTRDKDTAVWTSNVDGAFLKAGFTNVYRPQGDWEYIQCRKACRPDSVWESKEILDDIILHTDSQGVLKDERLIPKCSNCFGPMFGNVRADSHFLHTMYDKSRDRIITWIQNLAKNAKRLLILEVGAGFNTPGVTRFISEDLAAQLDGRFVRINPTPGHERTPASLNAVGLRAGWEVLREILDEYKSLAEAG